ncbi:phage tail protein [Paracoccus tibetensis]|uniref:Putative phage tail protein n=1 Tax=Paracoccus tibetensis TaxID=336292 RepID=A0A1G5BDK0_9RHOB|nr:phage tail protein [Paracoccus tibetensis]SCX88194.1 Putative phage tail protein [Paracoccus tibetensis]
MAVFSAIGAALWGIGYAVGFLGAVAGLSTATILSLASAVSSFTIAATMTAVQRALSPRVNVPQQEMQAVLNQTDAQRRVYVGQNLVGGIRALFEVKDGVLYQLVLVAHGRIEGFDRFWIDGEPQTLANSLDWWGKPQPVRYPTGTDKEGYVNVVTRNGSGQGGSYPVLLSEFDIWTEARRLQNQATFLVGSKAPGQEDFVKVFPKGHQTLFQWEIKGRQIYDPRNGQTVYSDNAALVTGHYLRHPDGLKLDQSEIDWLNVAAMADVSDIAVPQQLGGSEPSLRLWGYWTLDEDPRAVLDRMGAASGLRAYETQTGQIGLIGGPYGTPSMTLTAKDIRDIQTRAAISEREGYNVLSVHYMSALHNYEVIEVDPWRDEPRLEIEGEIAQELRMEMCPNRSQARRRGKQQIHDDNRGRVEVITNLVGLKARFPRFAGQRHTILLDYRPEDGSGRVIAGEFEVLDHKFDPVSLECRIVLAPVNRACQAWTPSEEGSVPELPASDAADGPPQLIATAAQRIRGGTASLVVEAEALGRDDLSVQARYRLAGTSRWTRMATSDLTAESGVVSDGGRYEIEARWLGVFEGIAPWISLGTVAVQINSTPPAAPTSLSVVPGGGEALVRWRNPPANFAQARIYRGTSAIFSAAIQIGTTGGAIGQFSEYPDATIDPDQSYYYWVAAANQSGVEGPPAGPQTLA